MPMSYGWPLLRLLASLLFPIGLALWLRRQAIVKHRKGHPFAWLQFHFRLSLVLPAMHVAWWSGILDSNAHTWLPEMIGIRDMGIWFPEISDNFSFWIDIPLLSVLGFCHWISYRLFQRIGQINYSPEDWYNLWHVQVIALLPVWILLLGNTATIRLGNWVSENPVWFIVGIILIRDVIAGLFIGVMRLENLTPYHVQTGELSNRFSILSQQAKVKQGNLYVMPQKQKEVLAPSTFHPEDIVLTHTTLKSLNKAEVDCVMAFDIAISKYDAIGNRQQQIAKFVISLFLITLLSSLNSLSFWISLCCIGVSVRALNEYFIDRKVEQSLLDTLRFCRTPKAMVTGLTKAMRNNQLSVQGRVLPPWRKTNFDLKFYRKFLQKSCNISASDLNRWMRNGAENQQSVKANVPDHYYDFPLSDNG